MAWLIHSRSCTLRPVGDTHAGASTSTSDTQTAAVVLTTASRTALFLRPMSYAKEPDRSWYNVCPYLSNQTRTDMIVRGTGSAESYCAVPTLLQNTLFDENCFRISRIVLEIFALEFSGRCRYNPTPPFGTPGHRHNDSEEAAAAAATAG